MNCEDIITIILEFVLPLDLISCSELNTTWNRTCKSTIVWRKRRLTDDLILRLPSSFTQHITSHESTKNTEKVLSKLSSTNLCSLMLNQGLFSVKIPLNDITKFTNLKKLNLINNEYD